jgi:hypothetical protein
MARFMYFVAGERLVDALDHGLGVPGRGAPVPLGEADLAAEVQHQRLQRRRRVERETHRVQLLLGGHQLGAEAAQVLHQDQGVFLLLVEPDRHEGGKVAVVLVVAQEHLRGREGRPLRDGVHLDGLRLLVREAAAIEGVPGNVARHVPADFLEVGEEVVIKHGRYRDGHGSLATSRGGAESGGPGGA